VVLISHGTGGAAGQMAWLAEPLAAAGFLAVAVDHHGNNFVDGYLPQGFVFVWDRPRDLSFALGVLAGERPLGPAGAAGFSAGGYTAAALVGARIDPAAVQAVVDGLVPAPEIPEFPDLLAALRSCVPAEELTQVLGTAGGDMAAAQVRAAFLVCPGLGELVTRQSMAAISAPVEIRWGDADTITPPDRNARRFLGAIPSARGRSAGPDVGHYDFLGDNPAGEKVRRQVAAEAVSFFGAQLPAAVRSS
jgi:predicted dienelactone hydrolase